MTGESRSILVVDDEQRLRDLVRGYMVREGFAVLTAADGQTALDLAREHRPDIVVLDLMLPTLDGLEVCRRLRTFSDAYVIMLTAKTEEIDRIVGLEVGADDYLTKPFSPRELVARVRAMLRRPRSKGTNDPPGVPPTQRFGELVIDHGRHEVTLAGAVLSLTPLEFKLLTALAAHPGLVFTRGQLLEQVWEVNYFGDDHVVDVHIGNLRKKLSSGTGPSYIETVRGAGYRFNAQPQ
jgi:two-component system, OmpR family, alkaline phosphatase synthesis response regulator PhoP